MHVAPKFIGVEYLVTLGDALRPAKGSTMGTGNSQEH